MTPEQVNESDMNAPAHVRLMNTISSLSAKDKKAFEKRIIQKHTQYGAVSMFKGVEDMVFAKSRTRAKGEILRIRGAMNQCESDIAELEKILTEQRVFCNHRRYS